MPTSKPKKRPRARKAKPAMMRPVRMWVVLNDEGLMVDSPHHFREQAMGRRLDGDAVIPVIVREVPKRRRAR